MLRRSLKVVLVATVLVVIGVTTLPGCRSARLVFVAAAARIGGVAVGVDREAFRFQVDGATQAGVIVFPNQVRPLATAVLLHGSGRTDHTSLLWLARLLAADGFAAVVYDKRGVGESDGTFVGGAAAGSAGNLRLLAQDVAAAAAHVREHPRLKGIPLGYIGFSQGGWVGVLATLHSPPPSFMLFLSGPVATVSEEGHFSALAEADRDFWTTHSREDVADYMRTVRYADDDFDPRPILTTLETPVLWMFGGRDNIMPVDLSIARLGELIEKGRRNFECTLYEELGHDLVFPPIGWRGLRFSEPYEDAVGWIRTALAAPAGLARREP